MQCERARRDRDYGDGAESRGRREIGRVAGPGSNLAGRGCGNLTIAWSFAIVPQNLGPW
jgi:hypothetical protein